ncbi:MAG: hypothetical protein P8H25_00585 [Flavobacteriaceae bacterium]|nr:hypothetical protein [Flavobacteriaceae bacterium]
MKSEQQFKDTNPKSGEELKLLEYQSNKDISTKVLMNENKSLLKQLEEAQSIIAQKNKDIDALRIKFASIEKDVIALVESISSKSFEACKITSKDIIKCMNNRFKNLAKKLPINSLKFYLKDLIPIICASILILRNFNVLTWGLL